MNIRTELEARHLNHDLARLVACRIGMILVLTVLFLGTLTSSASAAGSALCKFGCKKANNSCKLNGKAHFKGCMIGCDKDFNESAGLPEDHEAHMMCRLACKSKKASDKLGCSDDLAACAGGCLANPGCSDICGAGLASCAMLVINSTQACVNSCGLDPDCLKGCTSPGNVASHRGEAATDDCYYNPNNGFGICMSGGCTATCGNGVIEPGEDCDDNGTASHDGCSSTCTNEDSDSDGILDDGNFDGIVGGTPCTGGNTSGCDDNCPYHANANQQDSDSDTVGDPCDVNCSVGSGADVDGVTYLDNAGSGNELPGTRVTACKSDNSCCSQAVADGNGAYRFFNLGTGSYNVVAHPEGNVIGGAISGLSISGAQTYSGNDIVNHAPDAPPAGTSISNSTIGGIPSVVPSNSNTLNATGCVGGSAQYSITLFGNVIVPPTAMIEDPNAPGTYSAVIPPNSFVAGGTNQVVIDIDCPNSPDEQIDFDVYIDPSGFVRYRDGSGAIGATVTLLRSDTPDGLFEVVPDGSSVMSPKNRTNPDLTDGDGHFGWDVIPGYYKVRAEIRGCVTESHVMTIPPAVTDLELELDCPCIAGPKPACRLAGDSKLTIADDPSDDSRDAFQWRWNHGPATTQAELGSPLSTTSYDVCVYSGGSSLLAYTIPASAMLWQPTGSAADQGFKYGDSESLMSGIGKAMLKAGVDGKSSIKIKGKGMSLPDTSIGSLPTPIIVQLQRSDDDTCFESSFDANDVTVNNTEQLKAKTQ